MNPATSPYRDAPSGLRLAYPAVRMAFNMRGLGRWPTPPAVLVYQMAKVASTTVLHSIRHSRPGRPVFHVHTLTSEGIETLGKFYRWCRVPALPWAVHLLVSRFLVEQLQQGVTPGRWKVVTLVRDPIARNLSLLFQLGPRLIPDFRDICADRTLDPVKVFQSFERRFPAQVRCLRWFDDELGRVFGVNPLAVPFDREAGHQVYRGSIADVLLIRTDRLNEVGAEALKSFLGLETFHWKRGKVGVGRANGRHYAELLDRIVLPPEYVDSFYESRETRHFFTPGELDLMRARWCGRREGAA